ncbi:hypothetical protein [Methylocella sp.]|jgi:hypothetical protein
MPDWMLEVPTFAEWQAAEEAFEAGEKLNQFFEEIPSAEQGAAR